MSGKSVKMTAGRREHERKHMAYLQLQSGPRLVGQLPLLLLPHAACLVLVFVCCSVSCQVSSHIHIVIRELIRP